MLPNLEFTLLPLENGAPVHSLQPKKSTLWFSTIHGELGKVSEDYTTSVFYRDNRPVQYWYPFEVMDNGSFFLPGGRVLKSGILTRNRDFDYAHSAYKDFFGFKDKVYAAHSNGVMTFNQQGMRIDGDYREKGKPRYGGGVVDFVKRSYSVFHDGKRLWVGTEEGLFTALGPGYKKHKVLKDTLTDRITQLIPLGKSHLLLGTESNGLILWNKELDEYTQFTRGQGLSGNSVNALFCNGREIYVACGPVLNRIKLDKTLHPISIHHFSSFNGLTADEVHRRDTFKGKIWPGTETSFGSFLP